MRITESDYVKKLLNNLAKEMFRRKHQKNEATSNFRPWIRLYQQVKWLNGFAITNDVALQNMVKDFSKELFIQ